VRNTNINLLGIGITLVGLQASGEAGSIRGAGVLSAAGAPQRGLTRASLPAVRPFPCAHAPPPRARPCPLAVGTLVSKTMLSAANAPYAQPQPGATLVSLDVFSLQASTNVLLAHFMSIVFTNLMLGALNRLGTSASTA
jgi:hypothetical protein